MQNTNKRAHIAYHTEVRAYYINAFISVSVEAKAGVNFCLLSDFIEAKSFNGMRDRISSGT